MPPELYDDKVLWFGPECIDLLVYHLARLVLNNRIYNEFNGFEITELKVSYGKYIPKSIIYNQIEYSLIKGDTKEMLLTLLTIVKENNLFTDDEVNILNALYIRAKDNVIPKIEKRHSRSA